MEIVEQRERRGRKKPRFRPGQVNLRFYQGIMLDYAWSHPSQAGVQYLNVSSENLYDMNNEDSVLSHY